VLYNTNRRIVIYIALLFCCVIGTKELYVCVCILYVCTSSIVYSLAALYLRDGEKNISVLAWLTFFDFWCCGDFFDGKSLFFNVEFIVYSQSLKRFCLGLESERERCSCEQVKL